MKDAKRITNFSTKTTWQPLTQNTAHAPAKLQDTYPFDHGPLSYQILYQTDELKHQLTNQYHYRSFKKPGTRPLHFSSNC